MFYIKKFQNNKKDLEFLRDMLYESIHIPENKPSKETLLITTYIRKYHEWWGIEGDKALIAFNKENQTIGAV